MDIAAHWENLLWWASGISLVALLATLVGVPWVVARLPRDYFSRARRAALRKRRHAASGSPLALLLAAAKNTLGGVLAMMGIIMLVTPGQGILTLLAGLLLMNFPGKYRLERWLVLRPGVLRALNWLRHRSGQPPFEAPE